MIPKAYCINLDRKPEQFQKVYNEFKDVLNIKRVSAIDGKAIGISGDEAVARTVQQLFSRTIISRVDYLIVLEDDVYKCPKFDLYWPAILNFINSTTNSYKWDFISLDFLLSFEPPNLRPYNDIFYKTQTSRAMGFMIYNIHFLTRYYNEIKNYTVMDMQLTYERKFIKLIPKELIVRQDVDKVSETSGALTSHLNEAYDITEDILRKFTA